MEITEVKIFLVDEEKLKAFVSIVLDKCFMINDVKVIQGREGLFISMPSRRKKNGDFKDVAHPLNNETRRWMESTILAEYEQARAAQAPAAVVNPAPARPLAQPEAQRPAAAATSPEPVSAEKTLEEVQERHLSDSFWSVT
jgi:stage V sporulation protein G